jgi:ecdysteroid kinase
MAEVPFRPEDVTAEWLSATVGADVTGFDLEQIGIGVGLLGRLYRITLQGNGSVRSVIAKFPTLDDGARMNVVEPLRFYEKEVAFYRDAAPEAPIATPRVYAAEFDRDSGDFVLLLEDLGDRRMCDQTVGCMKADAETAIDAMSDLHAHWWASDFSGLPWLPNYADPPFPQVIAGMFKQAWPRALEVLGEDLAPEFREYGERYPETVQWFMDEATSEPHTFVHGDFRLDNLFFATQPDDAPVTIVDYQISFKGRAGYDLGYFVSQSLDTDLRRKHEAAIIDRYHGGLASRGIDYPMDDLMTDYRRTVAYCFIYPIVACGQIEVTNDRMLQLLHGMVDRSVKAIEDNDALAILP